MESIAEAIVVGGLAVEVAEFPVNGEGLFKVAGCLLRAAEEVIGVADAVERGGLAPPVTEVLEQGQ